MCAPSPDIEHAARWAGCYLPPADEPAPLTVAGLLRDTFGVFALAVGMSGVAALVWLAQMAVR